jgi:hypothetical protein
VIYYKLDEDNNVVPATIDEFGKMYNDGNRRLEQENYKGFRVSTVFLGLSHTFSKDKPGDFFETMIFPENEVDGKAFDEYQTRCDTYQQALEMHETAKKYVEDLK